MITQENRLIAINTPLGKDVLLLAGFQGEEGLSSLFSFELELLSEKRGIAFKDIIGKNVTISISLADGSPHYFNGLISRFSQSDKNIITGDHDLSYYTATMVPWFWLLTRTADSRIFQKLSVPDIVEKVFSGHGFSDYRLGLHGSYKPRDYTVQYRETDFNFVSRLLEEEGICYFFEHEEKKHTLVLADSPVEHKPCPKQGAVKCQPVFGYWLEEDAITAFEVKKEIRADKYTLKDFNYETPNTDLKVTVDSKQELGPASGREIYDYPGKYIKRNLGDQLVNIRLEEEEARITTITGTSNCRAFTSGYCFELQDYFLDDVKEKKFVLARIGHKANLARTYTSGTYPPLGYFPVSGDKTEPEYGNDIDIYINHFECIPHDVPFRPMRKARKPVVDGVQTAIVVGPSGEEIYTDEQGRVKVQFHWDREGKRDENSSCWIRVSQNWAGTGWGAMIIPRIGHEVIVDFEEGDPDRPIITGRVYHGINKPPYKLPDEKTKSTIKTSSYKGGEGFNEIRFEDKKGEEQIFIHAEKNQDNRVKEDSLEWVGKDRHLIIKKEQLELVESNKHLTVKGDHNEKVDGTLSIKTGMDMQEKVGAKHALDAGQEIHLKAGMNVIIEAGTKLSLSAGGSFITIGPAGVDISGAMVKTNSGGAAGSGSGCSPAAPTEPKEADTAKPGGKPETKTEKAGPASAPSPQAQTLKSAAESGTPLCDT